MYNKYFQELRHQLDEEAANDFHQDADAFVLAILSHGRKSHIVCKDGRTLHIHNDIVASFDGQQCKQLINKPKLYLVQACQGGKVGRTIFYIFVYVCGCRIKA